MAVQAVANIVKSSLGPQGLDKMMVNDVGDVIITNDGATILKQLEVQHPAARVLVDLSDLQDQQVGDGTTSVVLLAAELLKRADKLVKLGVHPTNVIAGYKLATKESVAYLKSNLTVKVDATTAPTLVRAVAATTLNSKYIGAEGSYFADMVYKAITAVKTTMPNGDIKYPVQAINILKSHGKSSLESFLCDGYALARTTRAADGMPEVIKDAKIALVDFNLRQHRMQLGVQIQITEAEELERVREKERDITKQKIRKILDAGANVILTTQGIDDMALKYFVEAGAIAVRRVDRRDMKRIARATGAKMVLSMATLEGDEEFDHAWLGHCGEVAQERVGDWDFLFLRQCSSQRAQSIILRGANEHLLEETERSLHDALCAAGRTLESNGVCAGGGATETALAVYLADFGHTLGSREQAAVIEFAEALLVVPKTLALNAALDALDLLGKLKREHYRVQHATERNESKDRGGRFCGLDLAEGTVRNNLEAGVLEPVMTKMRAIRFASEAAVTILRIDDVIKIAPEPEEERGRN